MIINEVWGRRGRRRRSGIGRCGIKYNNNNNINNEWKRRIRSFLNESWKCFYFFFDELEWVFFLIGLLELDNCVVDVIWLKLDNFF